MSFVTIKVRRGTTGEWAASIKPLASGELGLDKTLNKLKVGDGTTLWTSLPQLNLLPSELTEFAQDAVASALTAGTGIAKNYDDAANTITIAVDETIANKIYVDNAVSALGNTATNTYVPQSDVAQPDGVASLDANGLVPLSQINSSITQNDSTQTLTNKTINLGTGITSIAQYDNISGFFGQSNIAIYQAGIDRGGRISISSQGVISITNSGVGYISGIVTTSGGTRLIITVGGNLINGTLAEFNTALTDDNFATQSDVTTINSAIALKAPLASPTFTGTVTAANLNVTGTTTTINSTNLAVADAIIYLSSNQYTADVLDIGFYGAYGTTGGSVSNHKHAGLVRNHSTGEWHLFSNGVEPLDSTVDLSSATLDTLKVGTIKGNVIGTVTGNVTGALTGNADTVTNGIYTTGSYSDPSWLTISKSKVGLGNVDNTSDVNKPVSTATQTALDTKSNSLTSYVTDSTQSRTIGSSDKYKVIEFTNASAISVVLPNDPTDSAFPIGSYVEIRQMAAGQVTVSATSPATLVSSDNQYKTRVIYSSIILEKRASNTWIMVGDTTA